VEFKETLVDKLLGTYGKAGRHRAAGMMAAVQVGLFEIVRR
jgi:hypothetical protein